jgi:hypothetical protein
MNSINNINEMMGNSYCFMYTIIQVGATNPSTIWAEIAAFDQVMQTTKGRQWFELHRSIRELFFNVVQDILSTIVGFVSVARRRGYHNALSAGVPIATNKFVNAQLQVKQPRQNLQGTILTMTAVPYKEAPSMFKIFQPREHQKRKAPSDSYGETSNTRHRTSTGSKRTGPNMNKNNDSSNTQSSSNDRVPCLPYTPRKQQSGLVNNIPPSATTQGKTILSQLATDTAAGYFTPDLSSHTRTNRIDSHSCVVVVRTKEKHAHLQPATSSTSPPTSIPSTLKSKPKWSRGSPRNRQLNGVRQQPGQHQQQVISTPTIELQLNCTK